MAVRSTSLLLLCILPFAGAQKSDRRIPETSYDLGWARALASPDKKNADNKWNPQFRALMQSSFHQRQTFWRDHGKFSSLPELVMDFLGVPEGVTLDQDRFVTLDGCVPHACSARGMVWIDTRGNGKPLVIFVAPQDVSTAETDKRAFQHLWLFSSDELNWQKMPPQFEASLSRWYGSYQETWAKYYRIDALMLTLVEPSGLMNDLPPGLLGLNHP